MEEQEGFGEIRVPDYGSGNDDRSNVTTKLVVLGKVRGHNSTVFSVERKPSRDGKSMEVITTAATCAGCDELFTQRNQAGGVCNYCGAVLCKRCAAIRKCWLCGRTSCNHCGSHREIDYKNLYTCHRH